MVFAKIESPGVSVKSKTSSIFDLMDLHRHALPVYMYVLNMNIKEQLFMYINI